MEENRRMGIYIPRKVLSDSQLGPTFKLVYAVMLANTDADDICTMTGAEIAEYLAMSETAAVHARWMLVQLGYVQRISAKRHEYRVVRDGGGDG